MMVKVRKFVLRPGGLQGSFRLPIPEPGVILHAGLDEMDEGGEACLWALVAAEQPADGEVAFTPMREFMVLQSGTPFDRRGVHHLATWVEGATVWHLFEVVRPISRAGPVDNPT